MKTLSRKLVGLLLLGCIGSSAILAGVAVSVSTSIFAEHQSAAIVAVRASRQHYLEQYFTIIEKQLKTFCTDPLTAEVVIELTDGFARVAEQTTVEQEASTQSEVLRSYYATEIIPRLQRAGSPARTAEDLMPRTASARILQSMYIARNPNTLGEKDLLDRAVAACDYNRIHGSYHPRTREYLRSFGYHDIFLFDLEGNLVYSVSKEIDFATKFVDGPHAQSNLAKAYRQAREATAPGQVFMVDYESYDASYGAPASFVAGPIFLDDTLVGVGAFQLPIDEIDKIVRDPSGLGETGRVYLFGSDLLMRSNTRFRADALFRQEVATEGARRALTGETATVHQVSFSGQQVLASFAPMQVGNLHWGIIGEIDSAEIAAAGREVRNRVILIGLAIALVISGGLWLILNRLVLRPVRLLTDAAQRLETGDYSVRIARPGGDELGRLSATFNHMAESIEQDVQERKLSAAALARSEERFDLTVRGSGDGLWDHDPTTGETWFSERYRELLGYNDEEDFPSDLESWSEHLHPDDRQATLDAFAAHLARDVAYDVEYRLKTRDGTYRWFRARGKSLRDETGRSYRAAGSISDITDQRGAQEELQRLSRAVEQSPATVVITNKDGDIEYANPKFTAITGYEVEEALGQNPRVLKSGVHPKEFYEDLWKTVASGKEWTGQICNKKKNGDLYWESASISPIRNASGEITHFVAVKEDVTDRKIMEEELQRANFLSDIALELTQCGYWHVDYSDPDYYYQSELAARMLGEPIKPDGRYHLQHEWFARLLEANPETAEMTAERYQGAIEGRYENYEATYAYRRPIDGKIIWLHALGKVARDDDGKILFMYGAYQDVTQRIENEEALQLARQTAEAATEAKGSFLANMSHEIRTPLNGIIGFTNILLGTDLEPGQQNSLRKIKVSSDTLLNLINDILDFSKIEAGKLDIEAIDFQLQSVLDQLADLFAESAARADIELVIARDPDVPSALVGDPHRLRQILVNLTNNAVKFTKGGEILVRAALAETDGDRAVIRFEIRDTGIGIPADRLDAVFGAFQQADGSTTRQHGGTGLGLSISRQLTERMGGRIGVESAVGKGSTFWFEIPFQQREASEEPTQELSVDLRGLKVLVADDNEASRTVLAEMLRSFGFDVDTVPDGEDAVAALKLMASTGTPYSLTLMDWRMPGLDGLAASRRIREAEALAGHRIIMVTAFGRDEEKREGARIGLDGFLQKPVQPSLLFDSIMEVFGKRGDAAARAGKMVTQEAMYADRLEGAHVLLAEDNVINQEVAESLLLTVGVTVDKVENGQEAIDRVAAGGYDAILMDMQMPVLDGYEATRLLRDDSRFDDLPIIAMTAHAMAGEREKCLEAGMNDYVAKPIDPDVLFDTLAKWISGRRRSKRKRKLAALATPEPAHEGGGVSLSERFGHIPGIDMESGLARLGGNAELYRKLLVSTAKKDSGAVKEIQTAVKGGDLDTARELAHSLKGASGNLSLTELHEAAGALEAGIVEAREGSPVELGPLVSRCESALAAVSKAILALSEESPPPPETVPDDPKILAPVARRARKSAELGDVAAVQKALSELPEGSAARTRLAELAEAFDFEGLARAAREMEEGAAS